MQSVLGMVYNWTLTVLPAFAEENSFITTAIKSVFAVYLHFINKPPRNV